MPRIPPTVLCALALLGASLASPVSGPLPAVAPVAGTSTRLFSASARPVPKAPGSLDTAFGSAGRVLTPVGAGDDYGNAVAVQTDGKVVVVGRTGNGNQADIALLRYDAAGRLDPAFGKGGRVVTDVGTSFDSASSVVVQTGGKLLVGGNSSAPVAYRLTLSDFVLLRYTPDGRLDSTFGQGGRVVTDVAGFHDGVNAMTVQPDGKIILAGSASNGQDDDIAVVRYTPDGRPDPAFGQGGKVVTPLGKGNDVAYGVAVQPDGRVVVAGETGQGGATDFVVLRYTPDGRPDPGFGNGGQVITSFGDGPDGVHGLALQPDGNVVVGGSAWNGEDYDLALARYGADGRLDPAFGQDGKVTTAVGGSHDIGFGLGLQPGGKVVVVGRTHNGQDYDLALVRYTPEGRLDPAFGTGGKVTLAVGTGDDLFPALALQANGEIVAAGNAPGRTGQDMAVVRFRP